MEISEPLFRWLQGQTLLETIGVISGILCVWLAARNNIWNWPIAIISVSVYMFIFFEAKLYADMGLQVYFMGMNLYGWYYWSRKPKNVARVPVKAISKKELLFAAFGIASFTTLLGLFLFKQTDAAFPFIDSFCTACSLVAQLFMARKVVENWLIWIFVDIIYVGVYLAKDLHLTAGMYALYVYIALSGYLAWREELKAQHEH